MKKTTTPYTENDRKTLRKGIQDRYREYHAGDKITYPDFEYNSNRANYEPLRNSFIEEFFVIRGIDRVNNTLHIPSTSTLVQIFCDDDYVPTRKIVNTCRAYADGAKVVASTIDGPDITRQKAVGGAGYDPKRLRLVITALAVILTGIAISQTEIWQNREAHPSGLVIEWPTNGRTVPMIAVIQGRVSNASTVWVVVRDVKRDLYYVQHPIRVDKDGTWRGAIHIGGNDKSHIGALLQIRTFVNPSKTLKLSDEDILYMWPEAELSSSAVQVVRGSETE